MNDFKLIFNQHAQQLQHLDQPNKKTILCFSGVPGSGKTTLAKEIESRYAGIRINNDAIRQIIDSLSLASNPEVKQQLLEDYLETFLIAKLSEMTNGLLILDSSIDRKYNQVKRLADRFGYNVAIISLNPTREQIKDRIIERDDTETKQLSYLKNLDRWLNDQQAFLRQTKPDFQLKKSNESEWPALFAGLDKMITKV